MKNETIGSFESKTKLVVQDISPSRTELKVLPSSLKSSTLPADVVLNNEYINYFDKKIPISHVFHEIHFFLKNKSLRVHFKELIDSGFIIEDIRDKVYTIIDFFKLNSIDDLSDECDDIYNQIKSLYKNIFLWKYTSIFKEVDFYTEYVKCVDYVLNNLSKFSNTQDKTYNNIKSIYKDIFLVLYDSNKVKEIYKEKFDSYLSTIMVFGDHEIPVLATNRGSENLNDERKHTPLILKLVTPLPNDIVVGSNFHLNSSIYSDDIIQRVLLYKKQNQKFLN